MISTRSTLLAAFGLAVCALTACGPSAPKRSLEVTAMRYDTTNLTACGGDVRNISPNAVSNLQVRVEFQNADGNRVRTEIGGITPALLKPNELGSFSVPYPKGSNDPPVVRCRAIEFQSEGVRLIHEEEASAPLR